MGVPAGALGTQPASPGVLAVLPPGHRAGSSQRRRTGAGRGAEADGAVAGAAAQRHRLGHAGPAHATSQAATLGGHSMAQRGAHDPPAKAASPARAQDRGFVTVLFLSSPALMNHRHLTPRAKKPNPSQMTRFPGPEYWPRLNAKMPSASPPPAGGGARAEGWLRAGGRRRSGGPARSRSRLSLPRNGSWSRRRRVGRSQAGEVAWTASLIPAWVNPQGQAQGGGSGRPRCTTGARPSCAQSTQRQPASARFQMPAWSSGAQAPRNPSSRQSGDQGSGGDTEPKTSQGESVSGHGLETRPPLPSVSCMSPGVTRAVFLAAQTPGPEALEVAAFKSLFADPGGDPERSWGWGTRGSQESGTCLLSHMGAACCLNPGPHLDTASSHASASSTHMHLRTGSRELRGRAGVSAHEFHWATRTRHRSQEYPAPLLGSQPEPRPPPRVLDPAPAASRPPLHQARCCWA